MKNNTINPLKNNSREKGKILLILLPFWTPQIPPIGISCLRSFLQAHGYDVKLADVNVEGKLRDIYNSYFDLLREYVSEGKRGNFYNIGHDVLQNHMMAYLNYKDENEYFELIKIIIYKTYFVDITSQQVYQMNEILDELYTWLEEYILDLLKVENPSVLGLSVYRGTFPASLFVFKLAKKKYPRIKTVMGGAVFSQALGLETENFERFLKETEDYIDKIIIGEGEILFLKYLEGELPEKQRVYTLEDINNETLDLNTASIPDFSSLNLDFYPNLAAYTSRGCPFRCSFCSETMYWHRYRKKKTNQVVGELIELYRMYKSQLFLMCDSLLNPIIDDLAGAMIDADVSIYWDGYLRVDNNTVDPDKTFLWRRGGLYRARLGIESGARRILDAMNKKVTIEQIKAALFHLANAGIKTTTYWVVGYPGETEEDFMQTLDLIEELRDYIYEAECNIFAYYLTGQANSLEWRTRNKSLPLYPESAKDMLLIQTWVLDSMPSREETMKRVGRFVEHCSRLGIANPYSLYDIHRGDERWKKLHKNAVPSLIEFKNPGSIIDENKYIKKVYFAGKVHHDEMELAF